jgi:hypothetical protein
MSADPSTASNAPAGVRLSSLISWSVQTEEVLTLEEPVRAAVGEDHPYRCIAMSTTWVCGEKPSNRKPLSTGSARPSAAATDRSPRRLDAGPATRIADRYAAR